MRVKRGSQEFKNLADRSKACDSIAWDQARSSKITLLARVRFNPTPGKEHQKDYPKIAIRTPLPPHFSDNNRTCDFISVMNSRTALSRSARFMSPWYLWTTLTSIYALTQCDAYFSWGTWCSLRYSDTNARQEVHWEITKICEIHELTPREESTSHLFVGFFLQDFDDRFHHILRIPR